MEISKMPVAGKFKYHPLIHGSWWRRDMYPKGRAGAKAYHAFMQTLTHKNSEIGLAKGWRKAEQERQAKRKPIQKIKFNSLEEMLAWQKKEAEEDAKLWSWERKERDRQRMLSKKLYQLGTKYWPWKREYSVKFYKTLQRRIKRIENKIKEVTTWKSIGKEYKIKQLATLNRELKFQRGILAKTKKYLKENNILPKEVVKKPKKKVKKKPKALPKPKPKALPKPKPMAKRLKIVKHQAVNIRQNAKKGVDGNTFKALRKRAQAAKKKKCPPGYSKLKKADLVKWLRTHGTRK